jgi:HNH endonuclease/NUMOD4 motif
MKIQKPKSAEVWRPIPDWDAYEISSFGQVRRARGWNGTWAGRILRAIPDANGYLMLSLSQDGKCKRFLLHKLVCRTFHGEPPTAEHETAHNDGNRLNCSAANLRWATTIENHADKRLHGTLLFGDRHPNAKLSDNEVRAMREEWRKLNPPFGQRQQEMARLAIKYGMAFGGAKDILRGRKRITVQVS